MRIDYLNEVCGRCGLTFGSHRADSIVPQQCPEHEDAMDWPQTNVGTFIRTDEYREIPTGTESKVR